MFSNNEGLSQDQIDIKQQIVAEISSDYQKYFKRGGPRISCQPAHSDIDQFVDAVKEAIDIDQSQAEAKVILKDDNAASGGYIFEDPHEPGVDVSGVVLYSMDKRGPGTTEGGNKPFDRSRRELKPRVRDVIKDDPRYPGQAVVRYSQWFDNYISFKVCAKTAHRANRLALWFEDLMEVNRYFFAGKGINRYYFDRREKDSFQQIGNEGYYGREIIYYVRTERSYEVTEQKLNNIVVSLTKEK